MTRQYVVGEFSGLLGGLEPAPPGPLADAIRRLRREIEGDSRGKLPTLALDALDLADAACWSALECGDVEGFRRCSRAVVVLRDFARSASLIA